MKRERDSLSVPKAGCRLIWGGTFVAMGIFVLCMLYNSPVGQVARVQAAGGVPTTSAVAINYNDNVKTVTLTFDEEVQTSGAHGFALAKLHLRDALGGADLVDLSSNSITETASSTTVTITLTEAQRATLIAKSGTAGGDAGKLVVAIEAAAAYSGATDEASVAGSPVLAAKVSETADSHAPTISSITTASGNTSAAPFTESVNLSFSETVTASGVTVTVSPSGISWTVTQQGTTGVVVHPASTLAGSTTYTVTVTAAPDLAEVAADLTTNSSVSFTTQSGGGAGASPSASSGSSVVVVPSPSAPSIAINAGASLTNSRDVNLTLSVGNSPAQMMLSNTADFANSSWLNYATSYSWTLTEGNGVKIVYAKFKNVGGSSDVTSATINLNVYAAIPVNVTPTIETPATQTPTGQTVAFSGNGHAEGALVLGTDGRTVYRVEGGQLYAFRSAEEFRSYGYDFASVLPASSDDMALTFAGIKSAAIGSLIKAEGHATVWLVGENNQIRPFPSLGMFTRLGYNLSNVISVPDLSGYFGGPVME